MRKIFTSIDIGTDTIKIVCLEYFNKKYNTLAAVKVLSDGVKQGLIINAEKVSSAIKKGIKEVESKLGTKITKVLAVVPSNNVNFDIVSSQNNIKTEDNIIDGDIIFSSLQKSLKNNIDKDMEVVTIQPIEYKLDNGKLVKNPLGMKSKTLDVKAVAASVPKKNVYSVVGIIETLGIEVIDIVFSSVGSYYSIKTPDLDNKVVGLINIDSIINDALKNNLFELHYQPIYSTKQKRFHSAEALIRLHDEKYGYISPDVFIPAAEKSGAIYQIGIFVFEEVCRFIKSDVFQQLNLEYIEINLSVAQCMQDNLANDLLDILHKYDVSPEKINLEITETAMESSYEIMMKNLNALAKAGITFSLDDYGTGFSNIQRIITMPLSIVKLDKSFIDEIHNPDYQVIVTNTIKMLKDLNLKILSEGVEGESQLGFLNEQECDYIQGYYFSKPLTKNDFISFILEQKGKREQ